VSESTVERTCVRRAARLGVPTFKLQGYVAGDPDRAFLLPGQRVWLVEFKAPEGRLSPRQRVRHAQLAAAGSPVAVIRSVEEFTQSLGVRLARAVD